MRVTSLQLTEFRSFVDMEPIALSAVNVFIGANNSGKTSVLRALYLLQQSGDAIYPDVRVGSETATVRIGLEDVSGLNWGSLGNGLVTITLNSPNRRDGGVQINFASTNGNNYGLAVLKAEEPHHFVVPFLSKRKTATYQEDIRIQFAMQVTPSMAYLPAKLSRISNPSFPGYEKYRETCTAILGFMVTATPSENGQRAGVYLPSRETIAIEQMGEGVPNIVTLLADLALSEGKLFLIEEPENDLHPTALKALLELIVESSKSNQFVISTHSNIVLRHLGAIASTLVYEVSAVPGRMPTEAVIRAIEPTPQARLEVLRDLGYSFSDFDLWDGWLFLEEASAERIIRDYLIPWFAPKLSRVRTLATGGTGNIEPTFTDFYRLARFSHLEQAYTGAAWVRVDGDESGQKVVAQLRKCFPSWAADHFNCFSQSQFEHYYPSVFRQQVAQALAVSDRQKRRDAKKQLLEDVRNWLDEDQTRAKAVLTECAQEIIVDLQKIESQLFGN
ncbi:AAA family ATPase [Acidovorax sp.]|uniref:AAA family ATPase n=1 Tax=Acidovorax sp. TaxID=1872122 RepID=UPI0025B91B92|nr:AAA family ATPase [Acidovorax sp.]